MQKLTNIVILLMYKSNILLQLILIAPSQQLLQWLAFESQVPSAKGVRKVVRFTLDSLAATASMADSRGRDAQCHTYFFSIAPSGRHAQSLPGLALVSSLFC